MPSDICKLLKFARISSNKLIKRLFDNYYKYSYNDDMSKEEELIVDQWLELMDSYDLEKIKQENDEFEKKKAKDYKEINLRYKMINLKELQKKYTKEYLDESCM